jgi:peptidoglycan hydrolase-like protein with peptidoglycan-binding domain
VKRAIVHLIFAVYVAGLVRGDQTIQSVQQALKDQGFYYGNVTGDKSAQTTAAIRRYQIRNGLQVTGETDPETLRSLNVSSNSASSSQSTSKPAVTQSKSAHQDDTSRLGQNSWPRPPSAPDRQLEMNSNLNSAGYNSAPRRINKRIVLAEVQRQLMGRGYYRGSIDGRYGRRTAFALGAFQLQSGLPPTGRLDMTTLNALGLSDANLAYTQPAPRQYETWVPITKFKHGKWKVKWKKLHRDDSDEYGLENRQGDRDAWWHGGDDDQ